jgi:hypothetical protein
MSITSFRSFSASLRLCGFLLICVAPRPPASEAAIIPKGYVCVRTTAPPTIDGVMNDRAWHQAAWTDDFVDIEGSAKPHPRFRTRVKMVWDDTCLYIGAELTEPHLWATLTRRDTVIFYNNDFEVFMDPDGDNLEYYELEMNALNTVWDLFLAKPYRDGGPPRDSWDIAGLRSAVHVRGTLNNPADTDTGWTIELALPWAALGEFAHRKAPPAIGDTWRINFSRVEWHHEIVDGLYRRVPGTKEDNWVWSPQGVIDMHQPEMWGYLQFAGPHGRQSEFKPDLSRRAKDVLCRIYHAEKEYALRNGSWATNLDQLGLTSLPLAGLADPPALSLTKSGFLATATALLPHGKKITWFIREDSRLWNDESHN